MTLHTWQIFYKLKCIIPATSLPLFHTERCDLNETLNFHHRLQVFLSFNTNNCSCRLPMVCMKTPANGTTFRTYWPFVWGVITVVTGECPSQRASDTELWSFFYGRPELPNRSRPKRLLNQNSAPHPHPHPLPPPPTHPHPATTTTITTTTTAAASTTNTYSCHICAGTCMDFIQWKLNCRI